MKSRNKNKSPGQSWWKRCYAL